MLNNVCGNCGGIMEWSTDRRKMKCPFCMTEFMVEEREEDSFDKANVIDPLLFRSAWDIESLRGMRNGSDFINEFIYSINEAATAEKVQDNLFNILAKSDNSDLATAKIHPDLFATARAKVSQVLDPGEEVLLYHNSGLFSKGKEGSVITDKRTITFDAKKNNFELHKDIRSIKLSVSGDCPTVQVNEQFAVRFSLLGSGYKGTGACAALICLYAFKQNPDLKQISLVM